MKLGDMVVSLRIRVRSMPCCGRRRCIARWESIRDYRIQAAVFGELVDPIPEYLCVWTCPCGAYITSEDWHGGDTAETVLMNEARSP